MKEYKFRWYGADGTINYRRVEVPSDAKIYETEDYSKGRVFIFEWYGADGQIHSRLEYFPKNTLIYLGRDKDGREVWEGDILVDNFGKEIIAHMGEPMKGWVQLSPFIPTESYTKRTPHITGAPLDRKEVWKS